MREPPKTFRQLRNEEARRRFKADIEELLSALFTQWKRLGENVVPPLLLATVPKEEMPASNERAELECRNRIDHAIRHWLAHGEFSPLRPSDEFWLAARFEHAYWLAWNILTPDRDGVRRYIPTYGGELLSGFREWLLIQTWAEVGYERLLSDMLPPQEP